MVLLPANRIRREEIAADWSSGRGVGTGTASIRRYFLVDSIIAAVSFRSHLRQYLMIPPITTTFGVILGSPSAALSPSPSSPGQSPPHSGDGEMKSAAPRRTRGSHLGCDAAEEHPDDGNRFSSGLLRRRRREEDGRDDVRTFFRREPLGVGSQVPEAAAEQQHQEQHETGGEDHRRSRRFPPNQSTHFPYCSHLSLPPSSTNPSGDGGGGVGRRRCCASLPF